MLAVTFSAQSTGAIHERSLPVFQGLERHTQRCDVFAIHTATFQPDKVQPVQFTARPHDQSVRNDVVGDHRQRANNRAAPDPHKLVNAAQPTDDDIVLNDAMPCDGGLVDDDHTVANARVMRHMTPRKKEAVIADGCDAASAFGSWVYRHMLADAVAFTDDQLGRLAFEFYILRDLTDAAERKDRCVRADLRVTCHNDVGFKLNPVPKHDLGPDNRKRANRHIRANLGTVFDNR